MAERKSANVKTIEFEDIDLLSIDHSVHSWFNTKHPFKVKGRKTPVVFGSWERFAQMHADSDDKGLNALRDHKGMLKLPLISIRRNDIVPDRQRYKKISKDNDPSIVFKKQVAESNFDKSRRVPFNTKYLRDGRYKKEEPVYDVFRIPYPKYILVPYTITFWSSYVKLSNAFNKLIWNNYILDDLEYKGHHFFGSIDTSSNESNVEEFSDEERIIRNSFNLEVEGYLLDKDKIIVDRTSTKILFDMEIVVEEDIYVDEGIDDIVKRFSQGKDRPGRKIYGGSVEYPE